MHIRILAKTDLPPIINRYTFPWSTEEKTQELWEGYWQEQCEGIRTVGVIEEGGEILGYGSFLRKGESPFFAAEGVPEINAVWIDEKHRQRGLGTALIRWMEALAVQEGYAKIGIGVGLYADYGPAQKLYFRLGYAPDGRGITYQGKPVVAGQSYPVDDDLIFWLVKSIHA